MVGHILDTSQVMELWVGGSVYTYVLVKRQTETVRKKIVAAKEEGADAFAKEGGIEIPMPAVLASGRKP